MASHDTSEPDSTTGEDSVAVEPSTRDSAPGKRRRRRRMLIGAISAVVVLFVAFLAAIPFMVMPMFLGPSRDLEMYDPAEAGIEAERITLTTSDGLDLAAWRTGPENPTGTVVIVSGIDAPSVTDFFGYARMLEDAGWDSLLIEMRARGESEGDEIGLGMTEWRDVEAGVQLLNEDPEVADLPIVAMGTSMGGSTVINSAAEIEEIDGVISLSGFASFKDMFMKGMEEAGVPGFIAMLDQPFFDLYLGIHFGFDSLKHTPVHAVTQLGDRPLLLAHSRDDSQVPWSQYEKLRDAAEGAGANLTTFERDGDLHFICPEDQIHEPESDPEFAALITGFLENHFG